MTMETRNGLQVALIGLVSGWMVLSFWVQAEKGKAEIRALERREQIVRTCSEETQKITTEWLKSYDLPRDPNPPHEQFNYYDNLSMMARVYYQACLTRNLSQGKEPL
jgi:hypothetical protein